MRLRTMVAALGVVLIAAGCSGNSENEDGSGNTGKGEAPSQSGPRVESGQLEDQYRSTFALDVDTASYGYARRAINEGRRPSPGTIRPEEFVNHFRQDYPQPSGNGFSVTTDGTRLSGDGSELRLLRIGLQTRSESEDTRKDANLTFVIDTSGSMAEAGRLDLVQDALHTLVDRLRPTDRVAIVAYEKEARMVRQMTPASDRAKLHEAINSLRIGGSTNLDAGVTLGYQEARRAFRSDATNRVILTSDGLANTGATTSEPILRRVADERAKGISLLCVGVGSEYGDTLMEQLADRGDGMAVYVSEREKARELFTERLPDTLELRARDAKAQVSFAEGAVEAYRLVGFSNRTIKARDFRNDAVDGGEIGPGHTVTALYVLKLRPEATGDIGNVTVRWQDPRTRRPHEKSSAIAVEDISPGNPVTVSPRLRVDVIAASFAERLRDGEGDVRETRDGAFVTSGRLPAEPVVNLTDLAREATELATRTEDKDVSELATAIRRASEISG